MAPHDVPSPEPATSPEPRVLDHGVVLEVWLDGRVGRFHAVWLRDNAQDAETRNPVNGQRLIALGDIPADVRVAWARQAAGRLAVHFQPEGKTVEFDLAWLAAHLYDKPAPATPGWTGPEIVRWDAGLADSAPVETYPALRKDAQARRRWLAAVRRFGFARVSGAPAMDGVAADLVRLFGYVRETNYGRSFDVRAKVAPDNLAYTNLGLQPHTDNPYRDPPPGLQVLACLQNSAQGGGSVLVDGFKVVERLQAAAPADFDLLAGHCARFAYAGADGVRLRAKTPILELAADGELIAVRFNNRSAAPFTDVPFDKMADYYAAYRRMAALIDDPALAVTFRLEPGELFVVDNLRVLHGREPYSGAGERWLQGCYADRDGLFSTLAALEEDET